MAATEPNAGHRALAALERADVVTGVITQNVDLLHTKGGSRTVINLHGTYAQVVCLDCGHSMSRAALAELTEAANPGSPSAPRRVGGLAVAPDADAVVADAGSFRFVDCPACGGMLKPTSCASASRSPKGCGPGLFTGGYLRCPAGGGVFPDGVLRLPVRPARRRARDSGGDRQSRTDRGDDLADVKVDAGCSPILALLADELILRCRSTSS